MIFFILFILENCTFGFANYSGLSERECLLSRPTIFPDAQRFLSIFFVLSRIEKCVKTN